MGYRVYSSTTSGKLSCDSEHTTREKAIAAADTLRDRYAAMRITAGIVVKNSIGREEYRTSFTV